MKIERKQIALDVDDLPGDEQISICRAAMEILKPDVIVDVYSEASSEDTRQALRKLGESLGE